MHVGVGGTNYDIVDNIVQRDVTTQMPTIFSSSLKGALREFFKNQWIDAEKEEKDKIEGAKKLNYIFGIDTDRNKNNEGNIGHFNFFAADLFSLPVQAKDKPFNHTTAHSLMGRINDLRNSLAIDNDIVKSVVESFFNAAEVPEIKWEQGHLGCKIDVVSEKMMKRIVKKLPVIARNKLDNGQSENLFYEEVVPRETRFVFFVAKNKNGSEKYSDDFDKEFEGKVVQIGANGSIGYGFCEISKIS